MALAIRLAATLSVAAALSACGPELSDPAPLDAVSLSFDGATGDTKDEQVKNGKRLAHLLGCTGCHGEDFSGGPFNQGRIAPNVSLQISEYEHEELDRVIRQGVARDGRKIRLMPSEMYQWLSDADYDALESYLRTLEPTGNVHAPFEPLPADLAQWEVDGYTDSNTLGRLWAAEAGPIELGPEHARGRYLAMNLCTECHNNQLQGYSGFTPDLIVIEAYSDEELERLLKEGKGNVRDELGLMSLVSPARFPHLTQRELDDLAAYLRARADALTQEHLEP